MTRPFQHRSLRVLAATLAAGATLALSGACNDDGDDGGGQQQEQNQQPNQEQDDD